MKKKQYDFIMVCGYREKKNVKMEQISALRHSKMSRAPKATVNDRELL